MANRVEDFVTGTTRTFYDWLHQKGYDKKVDGATSETVDPSGEVKYKAGVPDHKIAASEVYAFVFSHFNEYAKAFLQTDKDPFKKIGLDLSWLKESQSSQELFQVTDAFRQQAQAKLLGSNPAEGKGLLHEKAKKIVVSTDDSRYAKELVRSAYGSTELGLLPLEEQKKILEQYADSLKLPSDKAQSLKDALGAELGQSRIGSTLPKVVAQAAAMRGAEFRAEGEALEARSRDLEKQAKEKKKEGKGEEADKLRREAKENAEKAHALFHQARVLYRTSLEMDSQQPLAHRELALLLYQDKGTDPKEARHHLIQALKYETSQEGLLAMVAILRKNPNAQVEDPWAYVGKKMNLMGRHQDAIAVYKKGIEENPRESVQYLELIRGQVDLDPKNALARKELGLLEIQNKKTQSAGFAHLEKAYALGSRDPQLMEALADHYAEGKNYDKAVGLARERISLGFPSKDAQYAYELKVSDWAVANHDLILANNLLARIPNSPGATNGIPQVKLDAFVRLYSNPQAWVDAAEFKRKQGDYAGAKALLVYAKAVNHGMILRHLTSTYTGGDLTFIPGFNLDSLHPDYKKGIENKTIAPGRGIEGKLPEGSKAVDENIAKIEAQMRGDGDAYYAKKDYAKAKEAYDAALSVKQDDADAKLGLGKTLYVLGDLDGAYSYFSQKDVKPKMGPGEFTQVSREKLKNDLPKFHSLTSLRYTEKATALLESMKPLAEEVFNSPSKDPKQRWEDLKLLKTFYTSSAEFEKLRDDKRDLETASVNAVKAEILKFADELRNPPKDLPYAQKITNARLLIEVDRTLDTPYITTEIDGNQYQTKDYAGVAKQIGEDLKSYTKLLDEAPPGAITNQEKADAYAHILKEWQHLRKAKTPNGEEVFRSDLLDYSRDVIHKEMWHVADQLLATPPFNDSDTRSAINPIFQDIIQDNNDRYLNRLSATELASYAEKAIPIKKAADEQLEKAWAENDPQKQRAMLYPLIAQYASIGDDSRVYRVIETIEGNLPKDASPKDRLGVYMSMSVALQKWEYSGSGGNFRKQVQDKANAAADEILKTGGDTEKERIQNYLLVNAYYQSTGNSEGLHVSNLALKFMRAKIDKALESPSGGTTLAGISLSTAEGRATALNLAVQLDLALVPSEAETLLKPDEEKKISWNGIDQLAVIAAGSKDVSVAELTEQSFSEDRLKHLRQLNTALAEAKGLSLEDRMEQGKILAQALSSYQSLSDQEKPLIVSADLDKQREDVEKTVSGILSDWMDSDAGKKTFEKVRPEYVEPLKKRVLEDLNARFQYAMKNGEEVPWISANFNSDKLAEFVRYSQVGNGLLMQADLTPGPQGRQLRLEAAQIFAQKGLTTRVSEALDPLTKYAQGLKNEGEKVQLLSMVALLYNQSKMERQAGETFQFITEIGKNSSDPAIQEQGKLAEGLRLVGQGSLDSARLVFAEMPNNEQARLMLANLESGQKYKRAMQTVEIFRGLIQAKEKEDGEDKTKLMLAQLGEVERLIKNGDCDTFAAAVERLKQEARYPEGVLIYDIKGKFSDYEGFTNFMTNLVDASSTLAVSDEQFARTAYNMAHHAINGYNCNDFTTASAVSQMLLNDPYVGEDAKKFFDDLGSEQRSRGRWHLIKSLPIINNFVPTQEVSVEEGIKQGVMFITPFVIGRAVALTAELAWVTYATETLAWSPTVVEGVGFGVKMVAETGTIVLSNMTLETLFTGSFDHWSFKHFGKEFGSMLITMVLLHGVGAGMGRVGRQLEKIEAFKAAGEEATQLREAGKLVLNMPARVGFGVISYSSRIFSFAGANYLNSVLGFHEKQNMGLFERLTDAAITDAQMVIFVEGFDMATGERMANKQKEIQKKYGEYKVKYFSGKLAPLVEKMGLDPEKEGGIVLDILLSRVLQGEKIEKVQSSFGEHEIKKYKEIIKGELGVDPESPQGKKLFALLLNYSQIRTTGKPPRPLSLPELEREAVEIKGNIHDFVGKLGFEGHDAKEMKDALLSLSLSRGLKPEDWEDFAKKSGQFRKHLTDLAESVLGKGNADTPLGQQLMSEMLMSTLFGGVMGGEKPEQILKGIEEWAKTLKGEESNLNESLEKLLGKKGAHSPWGRQLAAVIFLKGLKSSSSQEELPKAMEKMQADLLALKPNMDKLLRLNRLEGEKGAALLAQWALMGKGRGAEALDALSEASIEGKKALTIENGAIQVLEIPEEGQAARQKAILEKLPGYPLGLEDHITAFQIHPDNVKPLMEELAEKVLIEGGYDRKSPDFKKHKEDLVYMWGKIDKGEMQSETSWFNEAIDLARHLKEGGQLSFYNEKGEYVTFKKPKPQAEVVAAAKVGTKRLPGETLPDAKAREAKEMARELGLTTSLNKQERNNFDEAVSKAVASGKVDPAQAKQIFQAIDRALMGADPLVSALLRREVFLGVLQGKVQLPEAQKLAKDLWNGEVKIDLAQKGSDKPYQLMEVGLGERTQARERARDNAAEFLKRQGWSKLPIEVRKEVESLGYEKGSLEAYRAAAQVINQEKVKAKEAPKEKEVSSEKSPVVTADVQTKASASKAPAPPAVDAPKPVLWTSPEGTPVHAGEAVVNVGGKTQVLPFQNRHYQRIDADGTQLFVYGYNNESGGGAEYKIANLDPAKEAKVIHKDGTVEKVPAHSVKAEDLSSGRKMKMAELRDGDTILLIDKDGNEQRIPFMTPEGAGREAEIRQGIKTDRETLKGVEEQIAKQRKELTEEQAKSTPDAGKVKKLTDEIAANEKILAEGNATFMESLAKKQRTPDGIPYAELMPKVTERIAGSIFDGKVMKDGKPLDVFDAQGHVNPAARIALREQMLAELQTLGIRVSTDNAKAVDSIIDLAITAKGHGLIGEPGGLTKGQFYEIVGELYLHNNSQIRIGATELTHVPMVVEGTLSHFETMKEAHGEKASIGEKKAVFLAALLHDAGKWDPDIKTQTGYTILKNSPFNKTGHDIKVKSGQSLKEAMKEQGIDPKQVTLPFDGMAAIMVHHDATTVRNTIKLWTETGLLTPIEGQRMWEAVQYHGFVSSWIMNNSLGGLGIKSHLFDTNRHPELKGFFDAYTRVSAKMSAKGIPDWNTLMQDADFARDVATVRKAFGKMPEGVEALMLGDHQGQIDVAKYMTILSGVAANKDATIHDLFFGESMSLSVKGVLHTHSLEQILFSPTQGTASAHPFEAAEQWLNEKDPKQPGLAQAILSDPKLKSAYEKWKADPKTDPKDSSVQDWLKTLKVKTDGKVTDEFKGIQATVEKSFYEFYALKGGDSPLSWTDPRLNPDLKQEIDFLAKTNSPFAKAAKEAQEGKLSAPAYLERQRQVGEALVKENKPALDEVMSFLGHLSQDPAMGVSSEVPPHGRMKEAGEIGPKLVRRGWTDMSAMPDIAGARIVVKTYTDAIPVIEAIEKKYPVRTAQEGDGTVQYNVKERMVDGEKVMVIDTVPDRDTLQRIVEGNVKRGYRAIHLVVEVNGHPVEIQIQTESIYEWGKIQHEVYKNKSDMPQKSLEKVEKFFKETADYLAEVEQGAHPPKLPERPDFSELPLALREKLEASVQKAYDLMKKRGVAEDLIERSKTIQGMDKKTRQAVAHYETRLDHELPLSVLQSLSKMDPKDAQAVLDVGLKNKGQARTVNGKKVVFTGEVLGIGSGRTVYKGYVMEGGKRVPVAIKMLTHSMGGGSTRGQEVAALEVFSQGRIGGVHFYGEASFAGRFGNDVPALVTNFAEGPVITRFDQVPEADREQVAKMVARDMAKVSQSGLDMSGDIQFMLGRDAEGRPVIQWFDLESVGPTKANTWQEAYLPGIEAFFGKKILAEHPDLVSSDPKEAVKYGSETNAGPAKRPTEDDWSQVMPTGGDENAVFQKPQEFSNAQRNADGTFTKTHFHGVIEAEYHALKAVEDLATDHPSLRGFAPVVQDRPSPDQIVITGIENGKGEAAPPLGKLPLKDLKTIPRRAWDEFFAQLKLLNDHGIYHGDINEGNILWDGKKLHLIDFGRAELGERKFSVNTKGEKVYEDVRRAEALRDGIQDPRFEKTGFPRLEPEVKSVEKISPDMPLQNVVMTGKGEAGAVPFVEYQAKTPGGNTVTLRMDPSLVKHFGGMEETLRQLFQTVELGHAYHLGGNRIEFIGDILGTGSSGTIFKVKVTDASGKSREAAVKIRTHGYENRVEVKEAKAAYDAEIQRVLSDIDPLYANLGNFTVKDGMPAEMMPLFDPTTTVYFTASHDLNSAQQAVAMPQVRAVIEHLYRHGISVGDVEFALTADGKVHLVDVEGVAPFNVRNKADREKALSRGMSVTGMSGEEVWKNDVLQNQIPVSDRRVVEKFEARWNAENSSDAVAAAAKAPSDHPITTVKPSVDFPPADPWAGSQEPAPPPSGEKAAPEDPAAKGLPQDQSKETDKVLDDKNDSGLKGPVLTVLTMLGFGATLFASETAHAATQIGDGASGGGIWSSAALFVAGGVAIAGVLSKVVGFLRGPETVAAEGPPPLPSKQEVASSSAISAPEWSPPPGQKRITFGRDPQQANIVIDDAGISRVHGTIAQVKGAWEIYDHSANGIFVNGEKITDRRLLKDGDVVTTKSFSGEVLPLFTFRDPAKVSSPVSSPVRMVPPAPPVQLPKNYLKENMGESVAHQSIDLGGIAAGRDPGRGYKDHNEDRFVIVHFTNAAGEKVTRTFAIDGMGGHDGGEFAAVFYQFIAEQKGANPDLSMKDVILLGDKEMQRQSEWKRLNGDPGAVMVGVEVLEGKDGSYKVRFADVGDAEAVVFKPTVSGGKTTYEVQQDAYTAKKMDDNYAMTVPRKRGETVVMRVDPMANRVDQAGGGHYRPGKKELQVATSEHTVQKGSVVVSGSDGLFENFISMDEMGRVMVSGGAKTANEMQTALVNEALIRMTVLGNFSEEKRFGEAITHDDYAKAYRSVWGKDPAGKWEFEGYVLQKTRLGADVVDPTKDPSQLKDYVKGHFKKDNVTAVVQIVGEEVGERPKADKAADEEPTLAAARTTGRDRVPPPPAKPPSSGEVVKGSEIHLSRASVPIELWVGNPDQRLPVSSQGQITVSDFLNSSRTPSLWAVLEPTEGGVKLIPKMEFEVNGKRVKPGQEMTLTDQADLAVGGLAHFVYDAKTKTLKPDFTDELGTVVVKAW